MMDMVPETFYSDVKDEAAVHVGAVLDPDVKGARIFAWGVSTHWNEILPMLRKLRPDREFMDDWEGLGYLKVDVDQSDALMLLKKWAGKDGWTPLEQGVAETIDTPWLEG